MNPELEKWIEAHTESTPAKFVRCKPDDLRALFAGKVLVPVELLERVANETINPYIKKELRAIIDKRQS